jgi:hypothetical protein
MSWRIIRPAGAIALGLIIILGSWIGPAIWKRRLQREQTNARAGGQALVQASRHFYADYGVWPTVRQCPPHDCRFGGDLRNGEVVNALRAVEGPGNENHAVNPNRTVYFNPPAYRPGRAGLDHRGDFLDSWGTSYQVVMDSNLSGICEVENSVYDGQIGVGVLVWSCGPDRRSDTPDDILSWKP